MRDLSRARDDLKAQERKARQQLNAFLLRHGHALAQGQEPLDAGALRTGWQG